MDEVDLRTRKSTPALPSASLSVATSEVSIPLLLVLAPAAEAAAAPALPDEFKLYVLV